MKNIFQFIKKHKILSGGGALLLVFLLYRFILPADSGLFYKIERADFIVDLKIDGTAQALKSYVIKAPSNIWGNARIVKMVPEGAMVKEHDFLIQFDVSEFRQKLLEARNKLETARANLASTQATIKSQMAELESSMQLEKYSLEQSRLRAQNAVYESENKRKEIELNLKKAEIAFEQLQQKIIATKKINKASLRQAELSVEQAQLKEKRASEDLKKLTILSPAEGLVVYKEVWEGDKMAKLKVGYSPWRGQPLMEIPSQNKMKIKIKINEVDISRVAVGQETEVHLDAIPDTLFSGKVKEIASLAYKDRESKKNVFDVEVYLDSADDRIKPGMTAHCRIIIEKLEKVLSLPIDAVITENEKPAVYMKNGDKRQISTGISNADFIVVEKGLEDGDEIRLPEEAAAAGKAAAKPRKKKKGPGSRRMRIIVR